jgi:hypothetical protein
MKREHNAQENDWATLSLAGCKYRDLALQVGEVSCETVNYGYRFCRILILD